MPPIKVMIVDDSAVVRQVLSATLGEDHAIEIIGTAVDPVFALERMKTCWPDVIVLDVEMPRMDGITFLRKIMAERPTPVVICSTLTEKGSETALQALSAGAVCVVTKPKMGLRQFLMDSSDDLVSAVKVAARANVRRILAANQATPMPAAPKLSADAILPPGTAMAQTTETVVATGWAKAEDTANPELTRMMKIVREQMQPEPGMELSSLDIYQKEVGGRPNYALVFEITAGEFKLVTCYVYDFDAAEDISDTALTDWLGMPAGEVMDQPGLISIRGWDNAPNLPEVEVRSSFIPDGSAGEMTTGFSGLSLSVAGFAPGAAAPR